MLRVYCMSESFFQVQEDASPTNTKKNPLTDNLFIGSLSWLM